MLDVDSRQLLGISGKFVFGDIQKYTLPLWLK
jgi:hypothetical protein